MRHRIHHRKLNRTSEHRKALRRNMAQNLIDNGQITTTIAKARDLRPFFERLVTLAVKTRRLAADSDRAGALRARRAIDRLLGDRCLIAAEHRAAYESMSDAARAKTLRMVSGRRYRTGEPKGRLAFTAESVAHRLIETIAPRFSDRPGGYTRLIRLAKRRVGDASSLAMLKLVGDEMAPMSLTKPPKSTRRRRADCRYAMAVKVTKEARLERRAAEAGAHGSEPSTSEEAVDADRGVTDEPADQ